MTEQLHFALAKSADMEYKTTRFEHQMEDYFKICESKVEENKELKEKVKKIIN